VCLQRITYFRPFRRLHDSKMSQHSKEQRLRGEKKGVVSSSKFRSCGKHRGKKEKKRKKSIYEKKRAEEP